MSHPQKWRRIEPEAAVIREAGRHSRRSETGRRGFRFAAAVRQTSVLLSDQADLKKP